MKPLICLLALGLASPLAARAQPTPADSAWLRQHLRYLTTTPQPRSYQHPNVLDSVAAYLSWQLQTAGARVTE